MKAGKRPYAALKTQKRCPFKTTLLKINCFTISPNSGSFLGDGKAMMPSAVPPRENSDAKWQALKKYILRQRQRQKEGMSTPNNKKRPRITVNIDCILPFFNHFRFINNV